MNKAILSRILSYANRHKAQVVIACLCAVVYAVCNVASIYSLRPILNDLVGGSATMESLMRQAAVLGTIYALGVLGRFVQQRLSIRISQHAVKTIRQELFQKLQDLPLSYFDAMPNGDVMSLFANDIDAIGVMLNNAAMQLLIAAVQLVATLVVMFSMHVPLSLLTIGLSAIVMFIAAKLFGLSGNKYGLQQDRIGKLNSFAEEMVAGQRVVKLFVRERQTLREFSSLSAQTCEAQEEAQFAGNLLEPVLTDLCRTVYAIIALAGGLMCLSSGFDVGGLTVFANFAGNLCAPVTEVAMQMSLILTAIAGASRVFKVMDGTPEKPDAPDAVSVAVDDLGRYCFGAPYNKPMEGHVELKDVTFGYVEGTPILKGISVEAKPGSKVAVVGSTGAGKTTIINLINRFYELDSGSILIDGVDVRDVKTNDLRRSIAIVLQDTHLFTGTVRENIRYGRLDATDNEVEEASRLARAHSFIERLENGYDTVLEHDGANLSQGQRQLLSIARAAISSAPVLILDEATSSVDTRTERAVQEGMDHLMENRTTFVIAHRLSTVRDADTIMYLDNGMIVESGTHDELIGRKGRYYRLYTGKEALD